MYNPEADQVLEIRELRAVKAAIGHRNEKQEKKAFRSGLTAIRWPAGNPP